MNTATAMMAHYQRNKIQIHRFCLLKVWGTTGLRPGSIHKSLVTSRVHQYFVPMVKETTKRMHGVRVAC